MNLKKEIGDRIAEFIREKNWSKAEFARRVGIYPQDVNRYLSGEFDFNNILSKLIDEGINLRWLLTGERDWQYKDNLHKAENIGTGNSTEIGSFGERLKKFAVDNFGSLKGLAEAMEIMPQALTRYVNDTVEPKINIIVKLMELGADVRWLLTGRSSEEQSRARNELLIEMKAGGVDVIEQNMSRYRIPIVSVIGAGSEVPYDDGSDYIDLSDIGRNVIGLRVKGDSMLPVIAEGDIVLISVIKRPRVNDYVAVRTKKGEQYVKKLMMIDKEQKKIALLAMNTNYGMQIVPFGEIEVIKKVVRVIKDVDY